MAKAIRFDLSSVKTTYKTKEGFLRTDAVVTRTGIFTYHNEDGSVRRELRDHREVFNADSLASMKMIPLANNHPPTTTGLLDPTNAKQYQVGFTGENVHPDGENVKLPITVIDGETIKEIENGKRGLSLGYECDMVDEAGEIDGMRFDCKQTNIRYNHLAIVDFPRAGGNARINLDSADIDADIQSFPNHNPKERPMAKVRIDGIEYEAAPEVVNFLTKETARADSAESTIKTEKSAHDTTKADRDSLKSRVDTLETEKKGIPALVSSAVAARIDLERKATVVLDEKDHPAIAGMTDDDIRKKIVLTVFPDAKLDGVSADYLKARVDSALEASDKSKRDAAMADQRVKSGLDNGAHVDNGTNEQGVEAAEKRYQTGIKEAYKQKTDGCSGSKSMSDKEPGSKSRK